MLIAIGLDRLLGLLLSYRQVVTLCRVSLLVVSFGVGYSHDVHRYVIMHRNLDVLSHQNNLTLNHDLAQVQEEAHSQSNGGGTAMDMVRYSKTVSNPGGGGGGTPKKIGWGGAARFAGPLPYL